ncbi:hypothetical protein TWF281_002142 [Arthrobotrys megalospora]
MSHKIPMTEAELYLRQLGASEETIEAHVRSMLQTQLIQCQQILQTEGQNHLATKSQLEATKNRVSELENFLCNISHGHDRVLFPDATGPCTHPYDDVNPNGLGGLYQRAYTALQDRNSENKQLASILDQREKDYDLLVERVSILEEKDVKSVKIITTLESELQRYREKTGSGLKRKRPRYQTEDQNSTIDSMTDSDDSEGSEGSDSQSEQAMAGHYDGRHGEEIKITLARSPKVAPAVEPTKWYGH